MVLGELNIFKGKESFDNFSSEAKKGKWEGKGSVRYGYKHLGRG